MSLPVLEREEMRGYGSEWNREMSWRDGNVFTRGEEKEKWKEDEEEEVGREKREGGGGRRRRGIEE
jgi:hypothetical protein